MKPTIVSFKAVLHAWALGDVERAEAIVRRMENLSEQDGYTDLRPDTVTFNTLINAYAKKRDGGTDLMRQ